MWSSPSRYFDTCNLTFDPQLLLILKSPQVSLSGKKLHKRHRGSFCYPSSTVWIAIEKTSSVFVGRRCHCLLSTRSTSMGAHTELTPCFCKYVRLSDLPAAVKSPPMQQSWRPLLSGKRMRSNACVLIRILPEVREEQKNPAVAGPA